MSVSLNQLIDVVHSIQKNLANDQDQINDSIQSIEPIEPIESTESTQHDTYFNDFLMFICERKIPKLMIEDNICNNSSHSIIIDNDTINVYLSKELPREYLYDICHAQGHILEEITVKDTWIDPNVRCVINGLLWGNFTVKTLTISSPAMNHGQMFMELFASISRNDYLENLSLVNCDLNDNILSLIVQIFRCNTSLKSLNLSNNYITGKSVFYLFYSLRFNRSIKSLDLSSNNIGNGGAVWVANMLLFSDCIIEELNLSNCGIDAMGIECIADSLKYNSSLKKLNLSGNILGKAGADAILSALRTNTTVEELNISNTELTDGDMIDFYVLVGYNFNLKTLDLSYNLNTAAIYCNFLMLLEKNNHMENLYIRSNECNNQCVYPDNTLMDCLNFLQKNTTIKHIEIDHPTNKINNLIQIYTNRNRNSINKETTPHN